MAALMEKEIIILWFTFVILSECLECRHWEREEAEARAAQRRVIIGIMSKISLCHLHI